MSKRYLIIFEIIWIVTGILCLAAGIKFSVTTGGPRIFMFAAMAAVSFLFAWLRHRERKKS